MGEDLNTAVILRNPRAYGKDLPGSSAGHVTLGSHVTTIIHKLTDPLHVKEKTVLSLYQLVDTIPIPFFTSWVRQDIPHRFNKAYSFSGVRAMPMFVVISLQDQRLVKAADAKNKYGAFLLSKTRR